MTGSVVLTRPEGSNHGLEQRLTAAGFQVRTCSVLRIIPTPPERLELPAFKSGDLCIFISANAARVGLPLLAEAIAAENIKSLAVGSSTAAELEAAGLPVAVPDRADSEGLLAMSELQSVDGRQVVLVKGVGGRGLLAEALRDRGADVTEFVCYRRENTDLEPGELKTQLLADPATVIQANSGETLQRLTDLLAGDEHPTLFEIPVVVPSMRVAELAATLGWRQVITAQGATDDAFLEALSAAAPIAANNGRQAMDEKNQPDPESPGPEDTSEQSAQADSEADSAVADEPAPDPVPTPLAPAVEQPASRPPKRSDWFARFLLLLTILALGGAGAAGYLYLWPEWLARDEALKAVDTQLATLKEEQTALDRAREDLEQTRGNLEQERRAIQQSLEQTLETRLRDIDADNATAQRERTAQQSRMLADVRAQREIMSERLSRLELRLSRLTATDRRGWLANEAAFLVRLASQRLLASRDVDAAESLLANADALLAQVEDPRLSIARRAVAADRAELRAAPKVDAVGIYARFAALIDQAAALEVVVEAGEGPSPLPEDASWLDRAEAGWQAALAKLSDYLVIRQSDAELSRMMTPDWEALVRQNLRMLLEQAQIAAISANQDLYATALERASKFAGEFQKTDPDRAAAVVREIEALSALNIAPELPDLRTSMGALSDAIRLMDLEDQPALPKPEPVSP